MAAEMLIAIALHDSDDQNQTLRTTADGSCTVRAIKERIESEFRVPINQQIIIYERRPQLVLTNEWATLQDILNDDAQRGLQPQNELEFRYLIKMGMPTMEVVPVRVLNDNNFWHVINVEVESSATVLQLKVKINGVEGVPPFRQRCFALKYIKDNGIYVPLSEDSALWTDFAFKGADIVLEINEEDRNTIPIQVVEVRSSGELGIQQTFDMEVEFDTVETLMAKIRKSQVYRKLPFSLHLVPEPSQSYLYANRTLSSYEFSDSTVYLSYDPD